jgi:hypothetical protein
MTSATSDPATMADEARLAEVAHLLARAYLRARVRATARQVTDVAFPRRQHVVARSPILLALSAESEPSCAPAAPSRDLPAPRRRGGRR